MFLRLFISFLEAALQTFTVFLKAYILELWLNGLNIQNKNQAIRYYLPVLLIEKSIVEDKTTVGTIQ